MHNDLAQNGYELVVVEGDKTGARARLSADGVTTIGTGFDCDIVLGNSGAPQTQHRIELSAANDQFKIQIQEGFLSIDGVSSDTTEAFFVAAGTRITLGSSVIVLQPDHQSTIATPLMNQAASTGSVPQKRFKSLGVSAAIGLCLVVAGVSAYIGGDTQGPLPGPEAPGLAALVEQGGYQNVTVKALENGALSVTGRVATRSEHIGLKSLLDRSTKRVELDVLVDEVLFDDVSDVYRLSGIEAQIEISSAGEVTALTSVVDTKDLDKVEARAYENVTGLASLVRRNTPPPVVTRNSNPDFTELPGKRIKMVVTTDPAFILTEDGSRYFTGAVLPSGFKIKSIFKTTVVLERDNETVDLIF